MRELKLVIHELRKRHGNKSQVAKRLGISPQLLGQYENGRQGPKIEFFEKWLKVFGEDIRAIQKETNVSHETKKLTPVDKLIDNTENAVTGEAHLYKELYERFLGANSKYLVIHQDMLKNHRLISIERMEEDKERALNDRAALEQRSKDVQILMETLRDLSTRPINIYLSDVKGAKE